MTPKYYDIKVPAQPTVLFSARQHPQSSSVAFFQIRTASNPLAMVPAIRQTLTDLDPDIPLAEIKTQTMQLNESIAPGAALRLPWFSLGASGVLAGLHRSLRPAGLQRDTTYERDGYPNGPGSLPQRHRLAHPTQRSRSWPAPVLPSACPLALAVVRVARSLLFGVEPYDPSDTDRRRRFC